MLELDRATEEHARLLQKMKRYAKALPRSELVEDDPIVIIAVPSASRAAGVERALAGSTVPLAVVSWTPDRPALGALVEALDRRSHAKLGGGR